MTDIEVKAKVAFGVGVNQGELLSYLYLFTSVWKMSKDY